MKKRNLFKILTIFTLGVFSLASCGKEENKESSSSTVKAYQMALSQNNILESDMLSASVVKSTNSYVVNITSKDSTKTYEVSLDTTSLNEVDKTLTEEVLEYTSNDAYSVALEKSGIDEITLVKSNISEYIKDNVSYFEVELYTSTIKYEYTYLKSDLTLVDEEILILKNEESNVSSYITYDEALSIALESVNLTSDNILNLKIKEDKKNSNRIYKVSFDTTNYEYEFVIEALTKEIIEFEVEVLDDLIVVNPLDVSDYISVDDAKNIIANYLNTTLENINFKKIKLDKDEYTYQYEIEFIYNDYEYDIEIGYQTGEILDIDYEKEDDDYEIDDDNFLDDDYVEDLIEKKLEGLGYTDIDVYKDYIKKDDTIGFYYVLEGKAIKTENNTSIVYTFKYTIKALDGTILTEEIVEKESISSNIISEDEALEIALNKILLTKDEVKIKKIELEYDDNQYVYEIEIKHNSLEYEFEIDANSGKILDYEVDED